MRKKNKALGWGGVGWGLDLINRTCNSTVVARCHAESMFHVLPPERS
jgi:hypothetical protein